MEFKRIDLFSPLLVIVVIIFYILFAFMGTEFHMNGLPSVSSLTYLYILYGTLIFFSGFLLARIVEKYIFQKNMGEKKANNVVKTFLDYIEAHPNFTEIRVLFWVLFSLALQFINLYLLGGIPLFSGYLKAAAYNPVTVMSYLLFLLSINVLLAKFYKNYYFFLVFLGVILFAATGYRAIVVGIILTVLVTLFYTRNRNFRYFLTLTPVIIVTGLLIGYVAAMSIEWQEWYVNPLSLIFIRAGYTLTILDKLIFIHNPHPGILTYSVLSGFFTSLDPRLILGQLTLNTNTSITATIFGPAIAEFGYIGLGLQMFFLGVVLELVHYLQKIKKGLYSVLYALGLAHVVIWVETSPMDLAVWIYFLAALIVVITALICSFKVRNSD